MTHNAAFKKQARALAAREGIPYAEARTRLLASAEQQPVPMADFPFGLPENYTLRGQADGRTVQVLDDSGILVGPLTHHRKHSPDGFTWGYPGSGPAELARCILIAVLGQQALCGSCEGTGRDDEGGRCWCDHGISLPGALYQTFKFERVARLPEGEWSMRVRDVHGWLYAQSFQITRGTTSDFAQPYALYALPDGNLLQQDFWRGENYRVVGCVSSPDEHDLMDYQAMIEDADRTIGRFLITANREGTWSVHVTPIIDFQPRA